jgi:hypothetical protein
MEFADSTQNHNLMAGIPNQNFPEKSMFSLKSENALKIRIVAT